MPLHAIWEQAQASVTAAPKRVAGIGALITTSGGVGAIGRETEPNGRGALNGLTPRPPP